MKTKSLLNVLTLVFFASGFSSLVYQVSWQRILTLYYSVEHISTTLIVSVYMMGLGLGAIIGGRLTDKIKHRVALYLAIELLIGLFGCISIPFLEFLGKSTAGSSYAVSFLYMFVFLGFPTFLMGITLPLLTKIFNNVFNNFLHSLSYLYFINTLGAAFGALACSYVLISFFGLDISIYFAAAINLVIALIIFAIRKSLKEVDTAQHLVQNEPDTAASFSTNNYIYLAVFITGFIAIGYEIIWFRIIGTIVKASPYAFSSVLFIFLLGIALGSYLMKKYLSDKMQFNRKNLFYLFQFLISISVVLSIMAYYYLVKHVEVFSKINAFSFNYMIHPSVNIPSLQSMSLFMTEAFLLLDVFIWSFIFIFIPTLIMGASFPLITSLAYNQNNEGDTVGKVYFFNVLGNVAGGLITGLILLSWLGTENSILLLSSMGIGFVFLIKSKRSIFSAGSKTLLTLVIIGCTVLLFPKRHELYGAIHPPKFHGKGEKILIEEGIDAVNVTYSLNDHVITFINGMNHGGRPNPIFSYETIETMSHYAQAKNVLVIGFGTGTIVESLLKQEPKPKITLVELSETLIHNLSQVESVNKLLRDKNVSLIYADGRKYLYNTDEKFDAILIDPLRSTTSFSNNLYSVQFFELVKNHLAPGGLFMVWTDEFHILPKTICQVFPYVKKYFCFCVASNDKLQQDSAFKFNMIERFPEFKSTLLEIDSAHSTFVTREGVLENEKNYPINEDYKPRCEYFIGLEFIKRKLKN
jgi:spermidine synthase